MNKKGLDPDSIIKKEEEKIRKEQEQADLRDKMRCVDPYGEEQWEKDDVGQQEAGGFWGSKWS
jgi:hypothetical protein